MKYLTRTLQFFLSCLLCAYATFCFSSNDNVKSISTILNVDNPSIMIHNYYNQPMILRVVKNAHVLVHDKIILSDAVELECNNKIIPLPADSIQECEVKPYDLAFVHLKYTSRSIGASIYLQTSW